MTPFISRTFKFHDALGRAALWFVLVLGVVGGLTVFGAVPSGKGLQRFDEEATQYTLGTDRSPIARLQERIDRGEVKLRHDAQFGYLLSLLEELKVSTNSQMLVFSKTSLQRERITPKTPRALLYNDEVYLGFIPGAPFIEVSGMDPKLGGMYYSLSQTKAERPKFVRTDQCLECHTSAKTMSVPGPLVRSFATDEQGSVELSSGSLLVNHRTPFAERWGGWYVTGSQGPRVHRGNLFGSEAFARNVREPGFLGNLADLKPFLDVSAYPIGTSDIVALMTLDHQAHMQNFITRLNAESTAALAQFGHVRYLQNLVEAFLKYLLFVEEAPLPQSIGGGTAFGNAFARQGPMDAKGRSLREFDLTTRLFKYPCSYLIYSPGFDALPSELKEVIYRRLWEILTGRDNDPAYQRLSVDVKRAILQILIETKADLPAYWKGRG